MKYKEQDIEALKAPDVLHAYCTAALGQGRRFGNVWKYPCPFGAHTRLKLEVKERDGAGVAYCFACGRGGTVFDVAAAVRGLDVRRDFTACAEEVAEKTGYRLAADDAAATPPHPRHGRADAPPMPRRCPAADAATPEPIEYLPPELEAAALEAVKRAHDDPATMARHAAALGLPADVLHLHADAKEAAALGLLGLTPDSRLLYVYTTRDAGGALRVIMSKRRGAERDKPRFLARGKKCALWGADALGVHRRVIITEGESDCLAIRAAVWAYIDAWAHDDPDSFPPADVFPVVLAKPDAGTFKPAWAASLRGRDVILAADNDSAGQEGARRTAAALTASGVRRVFIWTPPHGCKDARAALDPCRPWRLAESILSEKQRYEPEPTAAT